MSAMTKMPSPKSTAADILKARNEEIERRRARLKVDFPEIFAKALEFKEYFPELVVRNVRRVK